MHNIHNYKLTQLQLLNATPNSTNQIWHRDNNNPGLTVLIALRDVEHNGPTELLLHSHDTSILDLIFSTKDNENLPRIVLASINKGDAVFYDSRVLHRGRGYGNNNAYHDRPVLVLRWGESTCFLLSCFNFCRCNTHTCTRYTFGWDTTE